MERLDILNRTLILKQIEDIIISLSKTKKGTTFALGGQWGVGKSFILDMLEKDLISHKNEAGKDSFYVFHYNCWEYDFYEEPAIAITSALLEDARKKESVTDSIVKYSKATYKEARKAFEEIGRNIVNKKLGFDLFEILDQIKDTADKSAVSIGDFDSMYAFKSALDEFRQSLEKLAKKRTLVIVIDELDRCLPSYAIKVLERIHHISYDIENVIVLFAVDNSQLDYTIKQIFGADTETDRYLKKFISFRIDLDFGEIQHNLFDNYKGYFDVFEIEEDVKVYIERMIKCSELHIRSIEKVLERSSIVHNLVIDNQQKSSSAVLLFEMICGLCKEYALSESAKRGYIISRDILLKEIVDNINRESEDDNLFVKELQNIMNYAYTNRYSSESSSTSAQTLAIISRVFTEKELLSIPDSSVNDLEICKKFAELSEIISA